ncbi:MAG: hypothetical protein ACOYK8_08455 [Alphaproteobacteria bacterium]
MVLSKDIETSSILPIEAFLITVAILILPKTTNHAKNEVKYHNKTIHDKFYMNISFLAPVGAAIIKQQAF